MTNLQCQQLVEYLKNVYMPILQQPEGEYNFTCDFDFTPDDTPIKNCYLSIAVFFSLDFSFYLCIRHFNPDFQMEPDEHFCRDILYIDATQPFTGSFEQYVIDNAMTLPLTWRFER